MAQLSVLSDHSVAGPPDPAATKRQVRDAIAHLYDPVYLQRHPLARRLAGVRGQVLSPPAAGAELRRWLLEAIETIKPAPGRALDERASRPYRIMQLRYVDAMDPVQVQDELGVAKTQYYRDHDRALEAVADAFLTDALGEPQDTWQDEYVASGRRRLQLVSVDGVSQTDSWPAESSGQRGYVIPIERLEDFCRAMAALHLGLGQVQAALVVLPAGEDRPDVVPLHVLAAMDEKPQPVALN